MSYFLYGLALVLVLVGFLVGGWLTGLLVIAAFAVGLVVPFVLIGEGLGR